MVDVDSLELALERATRDPAYRPEFCAALLEAEVFIIADVAGVAGHGKHNLEAGARVRIADALTDDGVRFIPFFSSLPKLRDYADPAGNYLAMTSRSLFELTSGELLMLNPGAPYRKVFHPDEILRLLGRNQ